MWNYLTNYLSLRFVQFFLFDIKHENISFATYQCFNWGMNLRMWVWVNLKLDVKLFRLRKILCDLGQKL